MRIGGAMEVKQKENCKGCQERHAGCHSTCETYKAYREKIDKEKEARIQAQKASDVIDDYTVRRIERTRKALRRMKRQKRKGNK